MEMEKVKFRIWDKLNKKFHFFDFWEWFVIGTVYWESDWIEKDNLIVMQFTGLYDKDGIEIYEGDVTDRGIIKFQTNLNWDSGGSIHSGFYFETYGNEGELDYHSGLDNCKIIGNIYENQAE